MANALYQLSTLWVGPLPGSSVYQMISSSWPHKPLLYSWACMFCGFRKYTCDRQIEIHFIQPQTLPVTSQWYFGSLWKLPGQSLYEQHCGLITASSWLFSARCCGTSGRGCWLGCLGQQEWLWPGSWLQKRPMTHESTTFGEAGYNPHRPLGRLFYAYHGQARIVWRRERGNSTFTLKCKLWGPIPTDTEALKALGIHSNSSMPVCFLSEQPLTNALVFVHFKSYPGEQVAWPRNCFPKNYQFCCST